MLYYIPFNYPVLNELTCRGVEARLILDLPQTTLAEARKNLFVRDLVRHPYIRDSHTDEELYQQSPESILKMLKASYSDKLHEIKIVYQKNPNGIHGQEFFFYIQMDNYGDMSMPFKQLEFTCRNEFEVYYEAFVDDLLICGIPIRNIQFEEGNIVKLCFGAVYELAIVEKDNNGDLIAHPIDNQGDMVAINSFTYSCIHGFDLTFEIMEIIGAEWKKADYNIAGFWFELILTDKQSCKSQVIHVIKESYKYYLVIDDDRRPTGFRKEEFWGFDGFQRVLKKEYHIKFVPSTTSLKRMQNHIKSRHVEVRLLMELPDFIAGFKKGTDVEIIIAEIIKQYGLNNNDATRYFHYCRTWS